MNTNKKIARIVGALFLISNVTFLVGAVVFIEPILNAPDYLTLVSENRTQVGAGVLLEIINGIAYVGIAVLMFPLLKQRFESLALGYVGFRIVEFVMQTLTDISPLKLVTLSEEFVKAGASQVSSFQSVGIALLAERAWAFQMVSIMFGVSALLFYTMLYQTKLIPRFVSVWGLIGAAAVLINLVFDMVGVTIPNLGFLMLLTELFLGIWLIVKGFNPSTIAPETA
jgi:hypothetical protein